MAGTRQHGPRDGGSEIESRRGADGGDARAGTTDEPDGADERIELVAEPIRYRRTPLAALLVVALIPAIGLYVLTRWADGRADEYEASRDALAAAERRAPDPGLLEPDLEGSIDDALTGAPTPGVGDDTSIDDEPVGVDAGSALLDTRVFDYRRAPDAIATIVAARRLAAEVEPVFAFLDPTSCAAVSASGVTVASFNADVPVIPASVQKLVVAAVALDVLGPDHRFATSVAVPPPLDGEVAGDVFLIGGGDPLLTSDDFPILDDPRPAFGTTSLDVLADAVVAAGVTRIRGSVIGDGTRYDDEFVVDTWGEGIAGVDAGPYDALLVNDARVRGISSRLDDPNEAAAREFVRLLGERGIVVDTGWGSGAASTLVPVVGTVESEPLATVVAEMLTTSDNNTAEMLLKELGVVAQGNGSRAAGLAVLRDRLTAWGIDLDGITLVDGSGLSTGNRLTCAAVLELLQRFRGTALDAGLAVAGRSGTLLDEFTESPVLGRLRAKTGTLSNQPFDVDPPAVKALAGYVDADTDSALEFVVIANSADVSEPTRYRPLWSAFGDRFATYPDGPGSSDLRPSVDG
ncbi:MAG: D-alanyl-D-alanine carboxypeptidase/D-alanyl-D-alanine-endopeptidase [Actinomycetota bacterium]